VHGECHHVVDASGDGVAAVEPVVPWGVLEDVDGGYLEEDC